MSGEDEHAQIGQDLVQAPEQIHAIETRQLGIQDNDIGFGLHAELVGALAVAAFADDLDGGIRAENFRQHLTDRCLILDDDKSFHVVRDCPVRYRQKRPLI